MRKIYLLGLGLLLGLTSFSQCPWPANPFGTGTAPANYGDVTTITGCAFAGEEATINSCVTGVDYEVTYTGGSGNYITIYDNLQNPVAFGFSPLTFTATYNGTYYSQSTVDAGCGTEATCRTLDVEYVGPVPACVDPTNLSTSNATGTTVDLAWDVAAGAVAYNVEWGAPGFTPGVGAELGSATPATNATTANGLAPTTTYEFYVQTDCGGSGTSNFVGPFTFSTTLAALTCATGNAFTLYSNDFEAGFPSDWSKTATGNPQWLHDTGGSTPSGGTGPTGAFSGNQYMFLECSGGSLGDTDTLIAPAIDLSTVVSGARATFYYHMFGADMGTLEMYASSNNSTWNLEFQQVGQAQFAAGDPWTPQEVDLSAYAGGMLYIRFVGIRGNGFTSDMSIDLFEVEGCLSCFPVSNITASNETSSTVDLSWTNGASETAWIIEYGAPGFMPGTGTQVNVASNPATVTGLNATTQYDFYVYADCGGGDFSYAVGPVSATTLEVCPTPTGLTTTQGATNAMFDWNPGGIEVEWDVEYGASGMVLGSGTQAYGIILGSDTTVTGLSGSTNYDWYVRAVCDLVAPIDTFSLWVGPNAFTTDPTCPQPTALDTAGGNEFTAGLTWTPGGLEGNWNVEYGISGFTPGSGTVLNVNVAPDTVITGLTPGQTYEYYVQADCGGGLGTSTWAGPFTWTQPDYCADPSAGNFANLTATSVDFSWTAGGLESNWTIEYGVNGFTLGSGTQMQTINTTESITGLSVDTDYCFYVQANCGATPDSSSAWAGPFCITTLATCPTPLNLGAINITTTAANLMWQAGGSETSWAVEWGPAGFTPGSGTGSVNPTTNNPHYATGLTAGTNYDFYVQAICGASDSSQWVGPYSFATLCGTFMAPYNEDFDGVATGPTAYTPPNCWSNPAIGEQWEFQVSGGAGPAYAVAGAVDHTSGTGNYTWIDASTTIGNNELISPMIDISPLTTAQAGFYILSNNTNDVAQNTITLEYWNGSGWSLLGTYGANNSEWVEVAYTLPGTAPSVTQFRMVQIPSTVGGIPQYNDLLIDDFFVREDIPCPTADAGTAVTGPFCHDGTTDIFAAVTGASDDSGTFWFPSAAPGNQSFAATAGSMILTGLAADTDYTFDYVVNNGCDADTLSLIYNWSMAPNTGGDGAVTTCVNSDVVLYQHLTGSVDQGGDWSDDNGAGGLVNGIFNPLLTPAGNYDFTYTIDNGTCTSSSTVTVTVDDCAGVEENTIVMSVYPNPVIDNLTVNLTNVDANAVVELFTVQGQSVMAPTAINNSTINVNMSNVADGIYILKVTANGSTEEVRVVKK